MNSLFHLRLPAMSFLKSRWVMGTAIFLAATLVGFSASNGPQWFAQITTSCTCTKCQTPVLQDDFASSSVTASKWSMSTAAWGSQDGGVMVLNPPNDNISAASFRPITNPIAASKNWRVEFDFKITDPDMFQYADGMAFVFQAGDSSGQYYALELDTYYNTSNGFTDYPAPHLSLNYGTASSSFIGNHISQVQISSITDGGFHHIRVDFDRGHIIIAMDGATKIDTTISNVAAQGIYWYGWTGVRHEKNVIDNVKIWDFACPVCSDGTREDPEQCDNGASNGTACTPAYNSNCTYCSGSCTNVTLQGPRCGDGTRNGSEQCDGAGNPCSSGQTCNGSCQCIQVYQCGDGIDNDGDGLTDLGDPGCPSTSDNDEHNICPAGTQTSTCRCAVAAADCTAPDTCQSGFCRPEVQTATNPTCYIVNGQTSPTVEGWYILNNGKYYNGSASRMISNPAGTYWQIYSGNVGGALLYSNATTDPTQGTWVPSIYASGTISDVTVCPDLSSSSEASQNADLSIGMTADATVSAQSPWSSTVTITNNGPGTVSSFSFKVYPYPSELGLPLLSTPPAGCVPFAGWSGEYDCTVSGSFSPGQTRSFTFTYLSPNTTGQHLHVLRSNIMSASSPDGAPANNSMTLSLTVTAVTASSSAQSSVPTAAACGNGTPEAGEECGETGLNQCTAQQQCINCRCITQCADCSMEFGSKVSFHDSKVAQVDSAGLSESLALLAYGETDTVSFPEGGNYVVRGKIVAAAMNGRMVTYGSPVQFTTFNGANGMAVAALDTTHGVLVYESTNGCKVSLVTVNGTTVTVGAGTTLPKINTWDSTPSCEEASVVALSSTKIIITAAIGPLPSLEVNAYSAMVNPSAGTITFGIPLKVGSTGWNITSAYRVGKTHDLVAIDSQRFAVSMANGAAIVEAPWWRRVYAQLFAQTIPPVNAGSVVIGSVDGTKITVGNIITVTSGGAPPRLDLAYSNGKLIAGPTRNSGNKLGLKRASVSNLATGSWTETVLPGLSVTDIANADIETLGDGSFLAATTFGGNKPHLWRIVNNGAVQELSTSFLSSADDDNLVISTFAPAGTDKVFIGYVGGRSGGGVVISGDGAKGLVGELACSCGDGAVCGNGAAETGEVCGEPGLASCPTGKNCQDCQCVTMGNCSYRITGQLTPNVTGSYYSVNATKFQNGSWYLIQDGLWEITDGPFAGASLLFTNTSPDPTQGQWVAHGSATGFPSVEACPAVSSSSSSSSQTSVSNLCGNTVLDPGEGCDTPGGQCTGNTPYCAITCQCAAAWWPTCGDGTCQSTERLSAVRLPYPGPLGYAYFGAAVAPLGDIDGDTIPDIAISAAGDWSPNAGTIYVQHLTAAGGVKSTDTLTTYPRTPPQISIINFGGDIENVGDLDGNGVPDIAVGAWGAETTGTPNNFDGEVWIFLLQKDGGGHVSVKSRYVISSPADFIYFGYMLAYLGNGRLAVGSKSGVWLTALSAGGGGTPTLIAGTSLGSKIFPIGASGDLDGDGVQDLLIGRLGGLRILYLTAAGGVKSSQDLPLADADMLSPNGFNGGYTFAQAYASGDSTLLMTPVSIAPLADTAAGGAMKYLVGVQTQRGHYVDISMSWIVTLTGNGTNHSVASFDKIYSFDHYFPWQEFGRNAARVGDVDGDSVNDYVIGEPRQAVCNDGTRPPPGQTGCTGWLYRGGAWLVLSGGTANSCTNDCGGAPPSSSSAQSSVPTAATCGNGLKETGEGCDDGNTTGGDGCSVGCAVEPGGQCWDVPAYRFSGQSVQFATHKTWSVKTVALDDQHALVTYQHINQNYMAANVAVIQNGQISFGQGVTFSSSLDVGGINIIDVQKLDSTRAVISYLTYTDPPNNPKCRAVVAQVSGSNVAFGTPVDLVPMTAEFGCAVPSVAVLSSSQVVFGRQSYTTSGNTTSTMAFRTLVGTVAGTQITLSSPVDLVTGSKYYILHSLDAAHIMAFGYTSNPDTLWARVGQVTGGAVSWGVEVQLPSIWPASNAYVNSIVPLTPTRVLLMAHTGGLGGVTPIEVEISGKEITSMHRHAVIAPAGGAMTTAGEANALGAQTFGVVRGACPNDQCQGEFQAVAAPSGGLKKTPQTLFQQDNVFVGDSAGDGLSFANMGQNGVLAAYTYRPRSGPDIAKEFGKATLGARVGVVSACVPASTCNNGTVEGFEECDTGHYCAAGYSCSTTCLCEPVTASSASSASSSFPGGWQSCPQGFLCSKLDNGQCGLGPIPACQPPYEQSGSCGTASCQGECWRCGGGSSSSSSSAGACSISIGRHPVAGAATPNGSKVYVVNQWDSTVSVISATSNTVIATIPMDDAGDNAPTGIFLTPDGAKAYVTHTYNTVWVIETATDTVTATIPMGQQPAFRILFTPDGTKAYAVRGGNAISVINTATNTITKTIDLDFQGGAIAITPNGAKVYVLGQLSGKIAVISTATDSVATEMTVGGLPYDVAFTPDGTKAYVSNHYGNAIAVIATATDTVTSTITVWGVPSNIEFTADGSKAYVVSTFSGRVFVISVGTNAVLKGIDTGGDPIGLVFTPDYSKAYVADWGGTRVHVISTATDTITSTATVGRRPTSIVLTPNGWQAYVLNSDDDSVSVIDTATDALLCGGAVASRSSSSAAAPTCPNGRLDAGETCEIGVCCPGGQTCDHSCHCVAVGSSSSSSSNSAVVCSPSPWAYCSTGYSCPVSCVGNACQQVNSLDCTSSQHPEYSGTCGNTLCSGQCGRCVQGGSSSSQSSSSSHSSAASIACGNSRLEGSEQCEIGIPCVNGKVCTNCICTTIGFCGDDVVDPLRSEECEQNADCPSGSVCTLQCQCEVTQGECGNGELEGSEQCESGHSCPQAGQICNNCLCSAPPRCGNRQLEYLEECEITDPCPDNQTCVNCICHMPAVCGNGTLETNEQCEDDAHCLTGQTCDRSTCRCKGEAQDYCGDTVLNEGEECEMNAPCTEEGMNCDLNTCLCVKKPVILSCGDAILDPGEDCDIGIPCPEGQYCSFANCHCTGSVARCGDGKLQGTERCEIGVECAIAGEVCDITTCQCTPPDLSGSCGNGLMTAGEECEVGIPCPFGWSCDFPRCMCLDQAVCGDGMMDPGELCETNSACTGDQQVCDFSRCRCTGRIYECGNGIRDPGEECDDGNTVSDDGCSKSCLRETLYSFIGGSSLCGNGIVEGMEECDDGNLFSGDGCSAFCYREENVLSTMQTTSQGYSASSSGFISWHFAPSSTASSALGMMASSAAGGTSQQVQFPSSARAGTGPLSAVTITFPQPFGVNTLSQATVLPMDPSMMPYGFSGVPIASTGPEAVALVSAGAALGWAWIRRRRRA